MDLLGGYDSNSDSDAEPIAPAPQPPVMPNKSIAMEDKLPGVAPLYFLCSLVVGRIRAP